MAGKKKKANKEAKQVANAAKKAKSKGTLSKRK